MALLGDPYIVHAVVSYGLRHEALTTAILLKPTSRAGVALFFAL